MERLKQNSLHILYIMSKYECFFIDEVELFTEFLKIYLTNVLKITWNMHLIPKAVIYTYILSKDR